ncbi:GldM family protein [Hymenobacter daeguensis]
MSARLLLPAVWLLSLLLPAPCSRAQGRPLGPWRLTYTMEERWVHGPDTVTKELVRGLEPRWSYHDVKWDVEPDSIRLFLNCENPLIAPPQPRNGQPAIRFSATGATVRLDTKNKRLFIAPIAATVILYAHKGRSLVFKHVFKAISSPLPHIECWIGGGRASSSRHSERFSAAIRAIPQGDFASLMPYDAKYRVSQYQLILLRNNLPLGPAKVIGSLNLTNQVPLDSAQAGDKLQIDVQQVQRQNFRGVVEDIPYIKHFTVDLL